jgi:hypothetical protein
MGIDMHALNLLRWASSKSNGLGVTATIGRQAIYVPPAKLNTQVCLSEKYGNPQYCEELLLEAFGAERVDSFDNSDYEGCTYVADFSKPLDPPGNYDTVIDCGCIEHIYNIPQALWNISLLCKERGQILHCLPTNGFCGHGFWQISPELFFSLYSAENGYGETQVFIADTRDESSWYEVPVPSEGRRVTVRSPSDNPLYVICRTVKFRAFSHENVQQSDYAFIWKAGAAPIDEYVEPWHGKLRMSLKNSMLFTPLSWFRSRVATLLGLGQADIAQCNPSLIKTNVLNLK